MVTNIHCFNPVSTKKKFSPSTNDRDDSQPRDYKTKKFQWDFLLDCPFDILLYLFAVHTFRKSKLYRLSFPIA